MNNPAEELSSLSSRCLMAGEGTEKLTEKETHQLLLDCSRWLAFSAGTLLGRDWSLEPKK